MDVFIPQGDLPPQSDGNVMPTDLTRNRIFMRLKGTQSATVSGGDGGVGGGGRGGGDGGSDGIW